MVWIVAGSMAATALAVLEITGPDPTTRTHKGASAAYRIRFELFCYALWEVHDPPVKAL